MKNKKVSRSKKTKKLMLIAFLFIIITSIILLTNDIVSYSEITVITTEVAKKHSPIILEKKQEEIQKEEPVIVYENMTMDELAAKLESSMYGILAGKGHIFANYSIQYGVDPYLSLAIVLHETGCKWGCSGLVKKCNNVAGQKGKPSCNSGSYKRYDTLDEGIEGAIYNIYIKFTKYGLDTAEKMNPKYAEDPAWASKVNKSIKEIKSK